MAENFEIPGTDWQLERLTVGPLLMNSYLVTSPATEEAMLVDPGDEPERLLQAIAASNCQLTHLVCTHAHFDHVSAAAAIQASCDLPLRLHPDDVPLLERLSDARSMYGFPPVPQPKAEADLTGSIPFGGGVIEAVHVPGHCCGHVMLVLPGHSLVGDVIFYDSIGRTDLPGGDFNTLADSIREHVYIQKDETVLHCGHGPETTVGREARENPFVTRS
jgi:glyoxylase-like metal-dependent hydrolase (beta-lactamase superfamily II)